MEFLDKGIIIVEIANWFSRVFCRKVFFSLYKILLILLF